MLLCKFSALKVGISFVASFDFFSDAPESLRPAIFSFWPKFITQKKKKNSKNKTKGINLFGTYHIPHSTMLRHEADLLENMQQSSYVG